MKTVGGPGDRFERVFPNPTLVSPHDKIGDLTRLALLWISLSARRMQQLFLDVQRVLPLTLSIEQGALLIKPDVAIPHHLLLPELADEQPGRMLL